MLECLAQTVRRHPSVMDFEDVVQDGWLGVLDAAARFDPEKAQEVTYLTLRAKGAMRDGVRRLDPYARKPPEARGAEIPVERIAGVLAAPDPETDEQVQRRELKEAIEQAMTCLSPKEKTVLRLRFWENCTHQEIGALLGFKKAHIDYCVVTSRQQLKQRLRRAEIEA